MNSETIDEKSQLVDHLLRTPRCDIPNCRYISHCRTKQVRHVESYFILFVCGYGYGCVSSSRNFIAMCINAKHPKETVAMVHVNWDNGVSTGPHRLVLSLAPTMPQVPLDRVVHLTNVLLEQLKNSVSQTPAETSDQKGGP